MITGIKCPYCFKEFELSDAIKHDLEEQAVASEREKHKKELMEATTMAEEKVLEKLKNQFEGQSRAMREDLEEAKKRNEELIGQLTEMNKMMRELKQKDAERDLNMEKKLAEEEEKIRQDAMKKADEREQLKMLEIEKKLQDAMKVNDELKRKLEQGSQQSQGEVLELELEKILHNEFPNDNITPVAKGVRGADVVQEIWDRNGVRCGIILWETKNAKWNKEWIDKLKDDQRNVKADIAVLISENMPDQITVAGYVNGIWVAQRLFAVGIAMALRANVIQAYHIKRSVTGKNEKMEAVFNYISGTEFKTRMDVIIETFSGMQEEIEKEKRWFSAKWARQEKQVRSALDHTIGMHGDFRGLMGSTLPEIKTLTAEE